VHGRVFSNRYTVELDASAAGLQYTHYGPHQSGLAGAVATDESNEFSGGNSHAHIAQYAD